ncbi:hypothetical protein [Edaphobacter sp. DSM 109919]|uniref:Uncharacterized protein n=1 Tax=Edaphobacter paludis TaxID=3035702 RepID=A0AAU7CZH5_9BACT
MNPSTDEADIPVLKPITADSEVFAIIFARLKETSDELAAVNRRIIALENGQDKPPCKITLPRGVVRHNPSPGILRPLTPREMRQQRLQARLERQNKQPQAVAKQQLTAGSNGRLMRTGKPTSTRKKGKK